MPDHDHIRLHAIVDGRVQGVGFRYFVLETATVLKITGWVRNTSDGQVEVTAEGERKALERLLDALRHGPRSAYVIQVSQDWQPASDEFDRFDVLGTA
jgi:acylphosphatase